MELGSFARAAERVGRSQSAVSTQLRKLEQQAGRPLVRKAGRGLALTAAGEVLFAHAKRLLDLNDEAVTRVRGAEVEGWVRMGLPQDFAEGWLSSVLARFSRAHPQVCIEVRLDRSAPLVAGVARGDLDAALAWGGIEGGHRVAKVADVPMRWIGRADWPGMAALGGEPLPFAAFTPPCQIRAAAIAAMDAAGVPWRLVFTSPNLSGLWAAAAGGLGITVRSTINLPEGLAVLDPATCGLPPVPDVPLALHRGEGEPSSAAERLTDMLVEKLAAEMAAPCSDPAGA